MTELTSTQKEIQSYHRACRKIFNSPSGHRVLAMWKEKDLQETAVVANDPISTAYRLGRKEFVQEVLNHLRDDKVLEVINIETEY